MIEDIKRERDIFEAALEIADAKRRSAFLEEACAGDTSLLGRIEKLLSVSDSAEQFFAGCAPTEATVSAALEASELGVEDHLAPGGRVGCYKLLQKIGEGGCGVVFMAEQMVPVRRRVALKVIKLGMDTKSVIARFEAERQALAMMDHPNIARVLDAGATETGRPFFVMELVNGVRITEYCDENRLGIQQRLELFIQICHAIRHAHQKGIIHRDIKPSNILVTMHDGVPVPKVIDFGIAKATQEQLTDKTLFTAYAQLIGTPAYMSPEQAELSGLDMDTRSDIYSLGVLLYELLTGRTPFDTRELLKLGVDEMRRTLRERDPCSPSAKLYGLRGDELTTTALQRRIEPPHLAGRLRGELDWIVMKALEKDRSRRYETADALATDVRRYLDNEPILAHPPSRWYQLRKLVSRNRLLFASGAAVASALLVGAIISTCLFLKERAAEQKERAAEQAEAALRHEAEARQKVTEAALLAAQNHYADAEKLVTGMDLGNEPSIEAASLLRTLGDWHALNGQWPRAREQFWTLVKVDQLDPLGIIGQDYHRLAAALIESNDLDDYERYRQAVMTRFKGTTDPDIYQFLKCNLLLPATPQMMKDLEPFVASSTKSYDAYESAPHPEDRAATFITPALALYEYRQGDYAKAVDWCQKGLRTPDLNVAIAAADNILQSMSLLQLKHVAMAVDAENAGEGVVDLRFANRLLEGDGRSGYWWDWVFARILSRECEALFAQTFQSEKDLAGLQPSKDHSAELRMLGLRHALRNEWPQAAGCYGEAIELDQFDGWKANIADQLSRAVSLAEAGDTTGYEQYCLEEAARFNPTDSIMISDWMLKSCLLMPADGKLLAALAPLAQAAGSPFVGAWEPRLLSFCDGWRSVSLGLLEYRAGDFAKSVDWCRHCLSMPIPVAPRTASARLILAMSLHEIGQDDEARSDLQQARTTVEGEFAHPLPPHPVAEQGMWFDWIIARRLLREATAVFAAGPTQAAPTPQLPSPDP